MEVMFPGCTGLPWESSVGWRAMSGVNIPKSIFEASAQPFTSSAQPASSHGEGKKDGKLRGLPSWQDRLPPALSWQPEGSLPVSSTPMSEISFGLNSIQSKQSLGERVSLASKQMALSVLDSLATKPPGPKESAQDRAGLPNSDGLPAGSDVKPADMHTELSVR